jgi:hypothetical protein
MTNRGDASGEEALDQVARGIADGAISRSGVLKSLFAGVVGGLASLLALPARDAEARTPSVVWAVVDKDGNIIRGKHVYSVIALHVGTGHYEVTFTREVDTCSYVATALNDYYGINISAGGRPHTTNPYHVAVYTYSGTDLYDAPFSLVVYC